MEPKGSARAGNGPEGRASESADTINAETPDDPELAAIRSAGQQLSRQAQSLLEQFETTRNVLEARHADTMRTLAVVTEALRGRANEPPGVADLESRAAHMQAVAKAGAILLKDPLTEQTRHAQTRLLVTSVLAVLFSTGAVVLDKISVSDVDLTVPYTWALPLMAGMICTYYGVIFVAGYVRDVRVHEVARLLPASQMSLVGKKIAIHAAERFSERFAAIRASAERRESTHEDLRKLDAEIGEANMWLGAMNGLFDRLTFFDRLRLSIGLVLPCAVWALALVLCGWYYV